MVRKQYLMMMIIIHKKLETLLNAVATDDLALKNQAIRFRSAEQISIAFDQFDAKCYIYNE